MTMNLQDRITFQSEFIKEMSIYPRTILFDLYDADFKKAKKFFGEGAYDGHQTLGYYNESNPPVFIKWEDVRNYQFHMMRIAISPDPMQYLKNFNHECKLILEKQ